MKKMYIVVDEPKSQSGDVFTSCYETAAEATAEAERAYDRLTSREKSRRHIFSAVVTENDLADYADGDWTCWESCDDYPGCFDSNE